MIVFGHLPPEVAAALQVIKKGSEGLLVARRNEVRSEAPFPSSNDLESALKPLLVGAGFDHHVPVRHPRVKDGFEFDFFHPGSGIAVEVMGYRADDEIYKDVLKFQVHPGTRVGVVWVPRWKWISNKRTETNYRATLKALAFADSFVRVEALVAFPYDWAAAAPGAWRLAHVEPEAGDSQVARPD